MMTDELASEVASSILFLRDATNHYKGALARHIAKAGPIVVDGYKFSLQKHQPKGPPSARKAWRQSALVCGWIEGRDLQIRRAAP